MVLMCQELEMPNCIRLWDTLFADANRFEFLNFVGAAIIIQNRRLILNGDFVLIIQTLQKYLENLTDVVQLTSEAYEIKQLYRSMV